MVVVKPCERCGGEVSDQYHRVNSDNHGDLWSCPACSPDGETLTSRDDRSRSGRYERELDLYEDADGA